MKEKRKETAPSQPVPWLKYCPLLVCAAALAAVFISLLTTERELLWKVQELNLHLDTPLFFRQQMVVPGGLLTWLGTWFTEYFYHPALGVSVLCSCWALLMWLTARAFRVPLKWALLLLVPVALLLLTCVDMGYWIYYLKLRGHFFVATLGLCAACAQVWACRCLPPGGWWKPLFILLSTLVVYPLTGAYALLAALLMALQAVSQAAGNRSSRLWPLVAAVLAVVAVPLLAYRLVFYQTSLGNMWVAALPVYSIVEDHNVYYLPYVLLAVSYILLALFAHRLCSGDVLKPLRWGAVNTLVLAVLAAGTCYGWYTDGNFHKELRMQQYMEEQDWEGLLSEAAVQPDEPTRAIVLMRNLALSRLGRQGDEMYHYRQGAKESNTPLPVNMSQVVGRNIYYYYGLPNYCYRWCLEDGVEFGWRAEQLKYMARCAIVNGETAVARKYLNLLKHTRYHAQWATQQERYLTDRQALSRDLHYSPILHLMDYEDKLSSDQSVVEQFLMHHFVQDYSTDTLFHEQSMNAALWMKDIQIFWPVFFQYAQEHTTTPMPLHYQEAAYLYGHLEQGVDISRMPFDPKVKQSYDDFMQAAANCNRMGMTEEQMKESLYDRFGKTFYYEYFLIRNQKLY